MQKLYWGFEVILVNNLKQTQKFWYWGGVHFQNENVLIDEDFRVSHIDRCYN